MKRLGLLSQIAAMLLPVLQAQAASVSLAQEFTVQGRLLNSDKTTPMSGIVDITLGVYSPDGNCLLYEEKQSNVSLASSQGDFYLSVGSDLGGAKRANTQDPGNTLAQIFSNHPFPALSTNVATCIGGYTPASKDSRLLRVTVYSHSNGTTETLSPDLILNPTPQATVAETLQGLLPTSFHVPTANATQANFATLMAGVGTDASLLHNHDSSYLKVSATTSVNFGSGGIFTSGIVGAGSSSQPSTAQMEVKSAASNKTGMLIQGAAGQTANYLDVQNSAGTSLYRLNATGTPTASTDLVTKAQIDALITANSTTYVKLAGSTMTGALDLGGFGITNLATPSAATDAATMGYVDAMFTTGAYLNALTGGVTTATGPGSVAATVASVGGSTAAAVNTATVAANNATDANTVSTIVKRDASGDFTAGTITAALSGNAATATTATNFSGALAGDATGNQGTTVVGKLQGRTLASTAPSAYNAITSNGTTWAPGPIDLSQSGAVGTSVLPVANGGFAATSLTANNVLLGNGTSAPQGVAPGTTGRFLHSNGTTWTTSASAIPAIELPSGATALTDVAGSIAVNASNAKVFTVTLDGNHTLSDPTGLMNGVVYTFRITQDGTGSRTLSWGSKYKFPNGITPALSTSVGATDVFTFSSDGTNLYQTASYVQQACTAGSQIFSYTGADQTFTMPAGCRNVLIKAWGAGGGAGGSNVDVGGPGGGGAFASLSLYLDPGRALTVAVGGGGGFALGNPGGTAGVSDGGGSAGGYGSAAGGAGGNDGSSGGSGGGGGGGAGTVVYSGATVLLAAGGGGGGGGGDSYYGGAGGAGGVDGGISESAEAGGTAGSSGSAAGAAGPAPGGIDCGGGGGGGGGYRGGGAGTVIGGDSGGGGGAGGTSFGANIAYGSGTTPGNATDSDRSGAGTGGASSGNSGSAGKVVIYYSP